MQPKYSIKKIFPESATARYNVAAWQKADRDHIVLVGREVREPGAYDTPDLGNLVLFEIDDNDRITHERVLWKSLEDSLYLEDPRARVNDDGSISIGLTALLKSHKGYTAYPALVEIPPESKWSGDLPPICLIHAYGPGKNLTPLRKTIFLFRPESVDYHHRLLVFDLENPDPSSTSNIEFPTDLPWALWRIGTTMPPLWINEKDAILIIHGITIQDGRYIYSIGRAWLFQVGGSYVVSVHPEPLLTRESFASQHAANDELHPELRRVVYACGGVIKRKEPDHLYLYVNVGDRTTYEVKLALSELKEGLQ